MYNPHKQRQTQFASAGAMQFKNVNPRTREDRKNLLDKETLEKSRLRKRREGFSRYADPGNVASADRKTPSYCPESERFNTDAAFSEKMNRDSRNKRRQQGYEVRRVAVAQREEARWDAIDDLAAKESDRLVRLRQNSTKAKRNRPSEPYDPITLKYSETKDGQRLKYSDDCVRYRASLRSENLAAHQRSQYFDPITGVPQHRSLVIDKPNPPHL